MATVEGEGQPRQGHAVIVAGGGPTGLMLAGELALAGVDLAIVERRPDQDVAGSRAGGLHSRTIEVLDQRGIADRFIVQGQKAQAIGFAGVHFDLSGFPTRHPYTLGLRQKHIERILAEWVTELKVPIYRGIEVSGLAQDRTGVDVQLGDGSTLRAQFLVGCDGGRSLVRKAAGIAFPGSGATTSNLIATVELGERPPEWGIRRDALGTHAIAPVEYEVRDGQIIYADHGPIGVMVTERTVGPAAEPTLDDLKAALVAVYGTDYGVHSPTSFSRFTDAARQAASYRKARVLLAGDAAHVHPPDGGQGLQTGVQDAVNLGWKLAQVLKGISPESLLDTYHEERHPIGARALRNAMAAVVLRREDDRTKALRETIAELLSMDEPRRRFAAMMSGLDIHYAPWRGTSAAGTSRPGSRPDHKQGAGAALHAPPRRPAYATQPIPTRRLGLRALGRSRAQHRGQLSGRVGASGAWRGRRAKRRFDPARRIRGLGGRGELHGPS